MSWKGIRVAQVSLPISIHASAAMEAFQGSNLPPGGARNGNAGSSRRFGHGDPNLIPRGGFFGAIASFPYREIGQVCRASIVEGSIAPGLPRNTWNDAPLAEPLLAGTPTLQGIMNVLTSGTGTPITRRFRQASRVLVPNVHCCTLPSILEVRPTSSRFRRKHDYPRP
jgi:hypothetical protein